MAYARPGYTLIYKDDAKGYPFVTYLEWKEESSIFEKEMYFFLPTSAIQEIGVVSLTLLRKVSPGLSDPLSSLTRMNSRGAVEQKAVLFQNSERG